MNEYKFIISCDATCDLPDDVRAKVAMEKMVYTVDDVEMGGNTGLDLDIKQFNDKMRAGAITKTSQISLEEAEAWFDGFASKGQEVLHIPLGGALSTTADNHIRAAERINEKYGKKLIWALDSLGASGGLGVMIALAVEKRESGASVEETFRYIEEAKHRVCHYFVVDDLVYLFRGGRVSRTSMIIGGLVKIKPLLHASREGKLVPLKKIISRKKSLQALAEKFKEHYNGESDIIYISHADCQEDALYVAKLVEDACGIKPEILSMCRVVNSHSGPGTLALFFTADAREE